MRSVSIELYQFEELSEQAKRFAIQDFELTLDSYGHDDAMASINKLASHLDCSITCKMDDISDYTECRIRVDTPYHLDFNDTTYRVDSLGEFDNYFKGKEGHFPLTGNSFDKVVIDPFRAMFFSDLFSRRTIEKSFEQAFIELIRECNRRHQEFFQEESLIQMCKDNGYEFTKKGYLVVV